MPTVQELLSGNAGALKAALAAGVDSLSVQQEVTFTKYVRLVLPVDGFVFWVKSDLLSAAALINAGVINGFALNQPPQIVTPASTLTVKGSLHFQTDTKQDEVSTSSVNRVVFTAESKVQDLNQIGTTVLFVAELDIGDGEGSRYAFAQHGGYYEQAGLYHYVGNAVYSDLDTQLVDSIDGFDSVNPVVSNSLPYWLRFNSYTPPYPAVPPYPSVVLYPSYLVPRNLVPPYGVVHIGNDTEGVASAPTLDRVSNHTQLAAERVRVTLYGLRNNQALDWLDSVLRTSYDLDDFGIMNIPIVKDEKRSQVELGALAMKKTVDFEISYYQTRANNLARQLILEAFVTYLPQNVTAALYKNLQPTGA